MENIEQTLEIIDAAFSKKGVNEFHIENINEKDAFKYFRSLKEKYNVQIFERIESKIKYDFCVVINRSGFRDISEVLQEMEERKYA